MRFPRFPAVLCLLVAGALSACQSSTPPTFSASAPAFDPAEAAFIKKAGKAKIAGHAFWRDGKGGTVNAAGEIVRLVPVTAYSRARFATLYRGGRTVAASAIAKAEADPAYADYTRTTRAESSGRFEFDNVAPGAYFVTAQVLYRDKDEALHFQAGIYHNVQRIGSDGGAMYETLTVTGKETGDIKLVLTNDR